jgi:hypothetical protein
MQACKCYSDADETVNNCACDRQRRMLAERQVGSDAVYSAGNTGCDFQLLPPVYEKNIQKDCR